MTSPNTKNTFAEILAAEQAKQAAKSTLQPFTPQTEVKAEIKDEQPETYTDLKDIREAANSGKVISLSNLSDLLNGGNKAQQAAPIQQAEEVKPETETQILTLKGLQIIWHEGRHIEGATFEGCTFTTWQDAQKAFFKLWEVNEKGQEGGYTKVKVELSFNEMEGKHTTRVDITNSIDNGDFNPTQEHIFNYIKPEIDNIDNGVRNIYLLDCLEDLRLIEEETANDTPELSTLTIGDLLGENTESEGISSEELEQLEAERDAREQIQREQEETAQAQTVFCNPAKFEFMTMGAAKAAAPADEKSKIEWVEYSEKSFALIGKGTKQFAEKLKQFGTWNRYLKCGEGWIFSNKRREEVKKIIGI